MSDSKLKSISSLSSLICWEFSLAFVVSCALSWTESRLEDRGNLLISGRPWIKSGLFSTGLWIGARLSSVSSMLLASLRMRSSLAIFSNLLQDLDYSRSFRSIAAYFRSFLSGFPWKLLDLINSSKFRNFKNKMYPFFSPHKSCMHEECDHVAVISSTSSKAL